MKRLLFVFICLLLLYSCKGGLTDGEDQSLNDHYQKAVKNDGYSSLITLLEGSGYSIIHSDTGSSDLLRGNEMSLELDKEIVLHVYIYEDASLLKEDLESISSDGHTISLIEKDETISSREISYIDNPNYYLIENMIVLYVGMDNDIIELMNEHATYTITNQ